MIAPPGFWARDHSAAATLLSPLAALYGAIAARRLARPGARADVPVVCLGNPTLGGAGKTPAAIALATLLAATGRRPGFLSRGYGGQEAGPVPVDLLRHRSPEVGDEALLLARSRPTVVSRDRPAGAALLARSGVDVIVMDDGLQNPSLEKTISLLVVDGEAGIGNGRVFPAGPLRAPLDRQLPLADILLLVGDGARGEVVAAKAALQGLAIERAAIVPRKGEDFAGRRVLAFAGIGRPAKFFRTLEDAGAIVQETLEFPDHHPFRDGDCRLILDRAERRNLLPVTTAKDAVRLGGRAGPAAALFERLRVLDVEMRFADPDGLLRRVSARLG